MLATLSSKSTALTLSLVDPSGATVATGSGASPRFQVPITGGPYSLVVSSSGAKATYSLAVTYPIP
jgi:hypothetical protein